MNVTCTGCPAKYAVPDEKVRGKKVRITCKHCGTNIVVDGTAVDTSPTAAARPAAQPGAPGAQAATPASTGVPDTGKAAPANPSATKEELVFIVGFPDDRQQPHTVSQIVEMYDAGEIDDEALVWKDGMSDWLSPFDVPELAAAFRAKNVAPRTNGPIVAAAEEEEATRVVRSPLEDANFAAPVVTAAPVVAAAPVVTAAALEPADEPMFGKPAAARRVDKRAGAVDLFGGVADAGSEGDVSLDLGSNEERGQKLTGARNESSVLFSLDALTKPDPKASKAKEKAKAVEREASEALFGESAPDSLMNLGGGGLGALAAPDFTKPVSAVAQPVRLGEPVEMLNEPANKGRGGVVLLVGFVSIAAVAAVAFVMMKKQPVTDSVALTSSATTPVSASAEPSATSAPAASNAPAASAPPQASAATSATSATSAAPASSLAAAATGTASAAAAKPPTPSAPATPATPAVANKPAEPLVSAKPPEVPATPDGAAFDKNAAVAALSAAAASAASCKKPDGPTGSGKVSVTFAPSGRATATSVAGDLAGTEVGGCVARLFRAAKVPPFAGDPVTVSKSFTVQ